MIYNIFSLQGQVEANFKSASFLLYFFMSRYMKKVIDEAMRCATLAAFAARYSECDIIVGGHVIPKHVSKLNDC